MNLISLVDLSTPLCGCQCAQSPQLGSIACTRHVHSQLSPKPRKMGEFGNSGPANATQDRDLELFLAHFQNPDGAFSVTSRFA